MPDHVRFTARDSGIVASVAVDELLGSVTTHLLRGFASGRLPPSALITLMGRGCHFGSVYEEYDGLRWLSTKGLLVGVTLDLHFSLDYQII